MRIALLIALLAPLFGAALVLNVEGSGHRRRIVILAYVFALGGCAGLLARAPMQGPEVAYGFVSDTWRAGLATSVALLGVLILSRRGDDQAVEALHLGTIAAGIATMLSGSALAVSLFLPACTLGLGLVAWVEGSRRGVTGAAIAAMSDLLIVSGLIFAAHRGSLVPPRADGAAAALFVAAICLRILPYRLIAESPAVSTSALINLRVPVLLIAPWVSGGANGRALSIVAAVLGAELARRAVRNSDAAAALAASLALAVGGFALHTPASMRAAIVLGAGSLVGALFVAANVADIGAPSIGAAPLGATLPGMLLLLDATFGRAAEHRVDYLIASLVLLAAGWLAIAGVSGLRSGDGRARAVWAAGPAALAASFAFVPDRIVAALADHPGTILRIPHVPTRSGSGDLALLGGVMVVASALAFVIARDPVSRSVRADAPSTRAETIVLRAPVAVAAAVVAAVVVLFVVSVRRGFL